MLHLSLSLGSDTTTDRRQVCKHAVCGAVAPALLTSTSTRPVILSASAATCALYFYVISPQMQRHHVPSASNWQISQSPYYKA